MWQGLFGASNARGAARAAVRGGMIGNAAQDVGEPGLRIDAIEFCCGDQRVYRCTRSPVLLDRQMRPANLLSTPRFWHTVLYPELYDAECPFIRDTRRASVVCHASERREAMTLP